MPLVPMSEMLQAALEGGYAIGYFEAWDQYSLEAVLEAAEELESPVILGFGGVMMNPEWLDRLGLPGLGGLGRAVADVARVPVSLILNEVESFSQIVRGITYGFNAVMLQSSHLPLAENIATTQRVVEVAHAAGVAVEAELGELPSATEMGEPHGAGASLTDAEEAGRFVRETGVDALAVSVGNVHLLLGEETRIDFDRLRAIHDAASVPLVIHGGTSFPAEAVPQAIAQGVAKFNVGTVMKEVFWQGLREALASVAPEAGPQQVVGSRFDTDLLNIAKQKVKAEVALRIRQYGGAGRAVETAKQQRRK